MDNLLNPIPYGLRSPCLIAWKMVGWGLISGYTLKSGLKLQKNPNQFPMNS